MARFSTASLPRKLTALSLSLLLLSLGNIGNDFFGGVAASVIPLQENENQQLFQDANEPLVQRKRRLQGRFLHITDFHPDELYKTHSATDEDHTCHHGKGLAGAYGAELTDCDSPFSLVNATLDWIRDNVLDDVDFIVWTGDTARHDSDEKSPRKADEVLRTNRMVADKIVETVSHNNGGSLAIPVIPTFGNNDFLPHNIFHPGPNQWLRDYTRIWHRFIPEAQRHSFEFGGWFYVEAVPNKLAVFSLNTMYFFDRNAAVDGCQDPDEPGFVHMDWLRVQLQLLRERGMKAILVGHVPPARTQSKQNWDETCWQKYTLWLQQYRDIVVGSVYGHMNIDHFLLQDTHEIDIDIESASEERIVRESLENDVSIASKESYLAELRDHWGDLPKAAIQALEVDDGTVDSTGKKSRKKKKKKKHKNKKIGGKYAERYQLSLVNPSIVPNYFPTIRVVEYNITGMEDTTVWEEAFGSVSEPKVEEPHRELKRDAEVFKKGKNKKKGKKGKKGKGKKPKDPNLIIPDDPPKESLPGPAYKLQPFTFTGYTQYFANLTYINNDVGDQDAEEEKWRDGGRADKPKSKKPQPREFKYEVEYSTFDDDIYKLSDLTVKSFLKLAYRIGKQSKGNSKALDAGVDDESDDSEEEEEEEEEEESTGDDDVVRAGGKKKEKKKKKKKHHKKNKVWLHFLSQAFINTVPENDLESI